MLTCAAQSISKKPFFTCAVEFVSGIDTFSVFVAVMQSHYTFVKICNKAKLKILPQISPRERDASDLKTVKLQVRQSFKLTKPSRKNVHYNYITHRVAHLVIKLLLVVMMMIIRMVVRIIMIMRKMIITMILMMIFITIPGR